MDVNVDSVSFRDDGADAHDQLPAERRAPSQSMTMKYQLERQGDEWHVKSRNMESHGEQAQQPGQQAPPLQPATNHSCPRDIHAANGGTPLPPGHPATPKQ